LSNALLSAGNSNDLSKLRQITVSLSPNQNRAPVFPNILDAVAPSVTLPNITTMDRQMQNAYSEQGSIEIEQRIDKSRTLSFGFQHVRGFHLIMSVNQNVPTCIASGNNNGCRPNPAYANNSQYSPRGDSRYDGMHVSFLQKPGKWGGYLISYTFSKALDNVGEFFFSSPIDNFNIWRDYGRSDDDQRHRVVFSGSVHSRLEKSQTLWERLSRGFQLSGMVQYYSALPFNITAGTNTIQGTAARPVVNGEFISRNAGTGFSYFVANVRLSRVFPINERIRLEGVIEAFNALNHVNGVTLNNTFGSGAYPTNPSPTFRQITAVGDPRTLQIALKVTF
jgi:hypothetical protein